jgi:acyl-CoA dehydrogenase
MARMEDGSATMFLSDMNRPASPDRAHDGRHGPLLHGRAWGAALREPAHSVPDVLGEPGKGFRYAQVRLAPARLTHCMRWLGQARRAHDEAVAYARSRQAFGKPLSEHEGVGFMLADNDMDLQTSRLHIWHCAWLLDQGRDATSSRAGPR